MPSWVPAYPGASVTGNMSAQSAEGTTGTYTFKTKDNASQVLSYFENQMKSSGFELTASVKSGDGGMLTGESVDKKRTLMITAGSSGEGTEVGITAAEKK